jgi:hypothetical protein
MNKFKAINCILFIFLFLSNIAQAQYWNGIIDPTRAVDWSGAGVVGGIPSATWTQCGSTINAGASAETINAAIENCSANHYVQLGAGTFNLATGILMKSGVVLRGMGADQTRLNFTGTDPCAGGWSAICFAGCDSSSWSGSDKVQPGGENAADWTGGYAKGTTQITLTNMGSSGISVGQYIYLDQNNDTSTNGGLFTCETTDANPPCSVEGGAGNPGRIVGGIARQQVQIVKVTAINGNQFTISPGLYAPNWSSSKSPGAWWPDETIQNSGLEDLSVDASASDGMANVSMYNAANVWVTGTRQIRNCACQRSIIQTAPASHVTIQNNYFYGTSGHSQNYGVESYISSDNLVANNIFQHVVSPMMVHSNQGSVYAYNYSINDTYDDDRLPKYHWMAAAIGGHSGGVMYNLFEGNIGPGIGADYIHGNQTMNTVFRNYWLGSDPGRIDNTVAVRIDAWNRYWNVVGNVLGTPGYTNAYSGADMNAAVYSLGTGYDALPEDPLVATTMMRWGNYDTVNAAVRWNTSEDGHTAMPYPALSNPSQTLPASFYLSTKPSWWSAGKAWPAIGPDVIGGNIASLAGHAHSIPAKDCYSNIMGGPADGSRNPLSFDASSCYSASSNDTTSPSSPSGLNVQ